MATIQAFRVEDKEGRKVYDANGELMDHFTSSSEKRLPLLQKGPSGAPCRPSRTSFAFTGQW